MFLPTSVIPITSNASNGLFTMMPSFSIDGTSDLDFGMSGVLGLLGGDDALSAMAAVHIYGNRLGLGWYNNPGSLQLYRCFNALSKSASLSSILGFSKSVHTDPTKLFGLAGCKGPRYRATQSGTVMQETGYVADLFVRECTAWDSEGKVIPGRQTAPVGITIVDVGRAPPVEMRPAQSHVSTVFFASFPIAASIGACAATAVFEDWYATSLILIGITASGISSLVLGSADFMFTHPEPAKGSPAGDGILGADRDIVLVKGTEGAVNSITRGKFSLRFSSAGHLYLARLCSYLFLFQAIAQLLFIPSASLFGQIMFLGSLGISAMYNAWLSSSDKDKIHQKLLFQRVFENPTLTKYTLGTRTASVVFMLLVLQPQNPAGLLDELLPNDTKVWKQWKATILEKLRHPDDKSSFRFGSKASDVDGFTQPEKDLLLLLYQDAEAAYDGYRDYTRGDAL